VIPAHERRPACFSLLNGLFGLVQGGSIMNASTSAFSAAAARLTASVAILTAAAASASTLDVPGDYATIQDAMDAAQAGDEVVVAPGTYHESFAFKNAHVTVRSSHGAESTILDGSQGQPYALAFFNLGTSGVLGGFTLRNFNHPYSGAVTIKNAAASIVDCIFEDNENFFSGSAIRIETYDGPDAADIGVDGCTFRRNASAELGGALSAVMWSDAALEVSNCVFEDNTADMGGHLAINVDGPDGLVTVTQCQFRDGQGNLSAAYVINPDSSNEGQRGVSFASCVFEDHPGQALHVDGDVALSLSDTSFVETGNPAVWLTPPAHAEISGCTFCGLSVPVSGSWTDLGGNAMDEQCTCPGDGNEDGMIDVNDLLTLLAAFGSSDPAWDLDDSGAVDVGDVLAIIAAWGPC